MALMDGSSRCVLERLQAPDCARNEWMLGGEGEHVIYGGHYCSHDDGAIYVVINRCF